jgi:ABC-2 type transport system ATP-binding protein
MSPSERDECSIRPTSPDTKLGTMNAPDKHAIEISSVRKQFPTRGNGHVLAVNDVSLNVNSGEIVALLGPNGAGKTTLIDMLLGLTAPSSGKVRVFGGTAQHAVNSERVGAVLQTGGLLPDVTVRDTVRMIAATFKNPRSTNEVIREANLEKIAGRRVKKCSGGEQQRVRFALALLADPHLLVLDEPTAGMDPNARKEFWATMQNQASRGTTILFATHYLEEAQNFAERIVLMNQGRVIADGDFASLQSVISAHYVTARFDTVPAEQPELANSMSVNNSVVTFTCSDADALARYLLTKTDAHELTISHASLDDIFTELTSHNQDYGHGQDHDSESSEETVVA